jgi:hypothetical protein
MGYELAGWFYDAGTKGAEPVRSRPGFAEMLADEPGYFTRSQTMVATISLPMKGLTNGVVFH